MENPFQNTLDWSTADANGASLESILQGSLPYPKMVCAGHAASFAAGYEAVQHTQTYKHTEKNPYVPSKAHRSTILQPAQHAFQNCGCKVKTPTNSMVATHSMEMKAAQSAGRHAWQAPSSDIQNTAGRTAKHPARTDSTAQSCVPLGWDHQAQICPLYEQKSTAKALPENTQTTSTLC
jgi:hypothetical protein